MSYVISPDPAFVPFSIGEVVLQPPVGAWRYLQGTPQTIVIVPSRLFWNELQGGRVPTEMVSMRHAIPGVTTIDDEWPDTYRPQMRVNETLPAPPPVFVVQHYHGCPGVSQGDDNWDNTTPGYQPQMRLNTLPHTTPPPPVAPQPTRWKVMETFLPSAVD